MLTDREKQLVLELLSKISVGVGNSSILKEYETIAQKLQVKGTREETQ